MELKKPIIALIISLGILGTPLLTYAQDPNLTQLEVNKFYLNPAAAGYSGVLDLSTVYRNQWGLINKGYETYKINVNGAPTNVLGVGALLTSDLEGNTMRTKSAGMALAAGFKFRDFKRIIGDWYMRAGVMYQYTWKKLDLSKLIFADQLNMFSGYNFENPTPSSCQIPYNKMSYSSLSFGLISKINLSKDRYAKNSFELGGSYQLNLPSKNTFFDLSEKQPGRFSLYFASDIRFKRRKSSAGTKYISPFIIYQWQGICKPYRPAFNSLLIGANSNFIYRDLKIGLAFRQRSFNFRNTDAMIALFTYETSISGHSKSKDLDHILRISYSYDLTVSRLTPVSGGSHEISVGYIYKFDYICDPKTRMKYVLQDKNIFKDKHNTISKKKKHHKKHSHHRRHRKHKKLF